jgi:hypothetical protein
VGTSNIMKNFLRILYIRAETTMIIESSPESVIVMVMSNTHYCSANFPIETLTQQNRQTVMNTINNAQELMNKEGVEV